jgi:hypothetical protein
LKEKMYNISNKILILSKTVITNKGKNR